MRLRSPLRVIVTRREDKEQKLRAFILQHIMLARPHAAAPTHILLVARSLESHVVRAVAGATDAIAAAGLSLRLILAQLDCPSSASEWSQDITLAHEIRWAKHPRLIEAHEQLVLGPDTCWIGDCMRRDPAKCDAYESFVEDCGEAAGCAAVSFERLWAASQPLVSRDPDGLDTPASARAIIVLEPAPQGGAPTAH